MNMKRAAIVGVMVILFLGGISSIGAAHTANDTLDGETGPGYHYEDGHHANGTFDGHMMGPGHHHGGDYHFDDHDTTGGSHMWGPGFGGWMFLWPLVLLLVIAGLVYWATRRGKEDEGEDRAMRLLQEQYAKGEIDDEEFEERRSKLMSS